MDVLGDHPAVLARMVKTSTGSPLQERAARALAEAASTEREAIVEIGRAAMASRNASVEAYERSLTPELEAAGTKTLLVAANPDPGIDFMDPAQLAGAIEDGTARAASMIEELRAVWS